MIDVGRLKKSRATMVAGAAILLALGAAGGAGAVQATRPPIVMAPIARTPIAKLPATNGVVTVKGRVAEIYGDRLVVQDRTGRAMIAVGHDADVAVRVGQPVMVQGRYDDGQLRATFLVSENGSVAAVGPAGPPRGGPARHIGPDPRGDTDGAGPPPPPPPGCAPAPRGAGAPPLPPSAAPLGNGAARMTPEARSPAAASPVGRD